MKYDVITGDFLYFPNRLDWTMNKLKTLVLGIIQLTLIYSVMEVIEYMPFSDVNGGILNWKHLFNNMSFACT